MQPMTRGQRDYARHREAYKARAKRYRQMNYQLVMEKQRARSRIPEVKENRRLGAYGLTREDYQVLLIKQDNSCAICRRSFDHMPKQHIHIDHDHGSKRVRGILCHYCNLGIGNFKDDPQLLIKASEYLLCASM